MDTLIVTHNGIHLKPKSARQAQYVDAIKKNIITFAIGAAGSGKTFLAAAVACSMLRLKQVRKIILTRPAVEAGEKLGYLPGDLQDKVDPYLRPLFDALKDILGTDLFHKLLNKNQIEIAPLAFMRGRTLSDSFIILDEAQNTSPAQMKMFLTRLGFNSKMVITGDLSQIDLPGRSGLADAINILNSLDDCAFVFLNHQDVVRPPIVAQIVQAYERIYHAR